MRASHLEGLKRPAKEGINEKTNQQEYAVTTCGGSGGMGSLFKLLSQLVQKPLKRTRGILISDALRMFHHIDKEVGDYV